MTEPANRYATGSLDRAAWARKDPAQLAAWWRAPSRRLIPVWRNRILVDERTQGPVLAAAPGALVGDQADAAVFLGLVAGVPWFAADVSGLDDPEAHPALADRGRFADLREIGPSLGWDEANLAAFARALCGWHRRHGYCGRCGAATVPHAGGHVRRCTADGCAADHFPRTDPAVIMLVHHGDRCLLGRSERMPGGMVSTLAGFVEPGESLEDAVVREVFEETGVAVTDVQYHSSQPWPFPGSLMVGFRARATTTEITVDREELTEALWVDRAWLRAHRERWPRGDSIARHLIEGWLDGDGAACRPLSGALPPTPLEGDCPPLPPPKWGPGGNPWSGDVGG